MISQRSNKLKKTKLYLLSPLLLLGIISSSTVLLSQPVSAVTQQECVEAGGTWVPRSGANPYTDTCNYPDNSNPPNNSGTGSKCWARGILTFPVWYRGVVDDNCNVSFESPTDIWKVVLNVIEILIQLAGYLAGIYILMGGFKYLTSAGSPDAISSASNTIRNASIGLIIALAATAIVRFIAGSIG